MTYIVRNSVDAAVVCSKIELQLMTVSFNFSKLLTSEKVSPLSKQTQVNDIDDINDFDGNVIIVSLGKW